MKSKLFTSLLVVAFSLGATTAWALSLYQNGYNFNVRVTNSHFQSIDDARGTVNIIGHRATLEIRADGYRSQRQYVTLREGQTYYSLSARLQDPYIWYTARDAQYATIAEARFDENHIGAWGDEFKFELTLPKEGFEQFTRYDVDVRVGVMFVFGEKIRIWDLGDRRRVEITIKRRDMDEYNTRINVTIPRDNQLDRARRNLVRTLSFELLEQDEVARSSARRSAMNERLEALKKLR